MGNQGNRVDNERRIEKKGKANNFAEKQNKEIRRQGMDSNSAGQERLEVDGRRLRPAVSLIGCCCGWWWW